MSEEELLGTFWEWIRKYCESERAKEPLLVNTV